ncbi:MAG: hypothetical protein HZA79_11235 [Sphingobacteriales bacterium]|nr:hypothetical protein [Sphingobacteriales bacterium]
MKRSICLILFLLVICSGGSSLCAQEGLQVMLRADDSLGAMVLQNEPVIFSVTITNKAARSDQSWNASADRRIRQLNELEKQGKIKKEEADRERAELERGKRKSTSIRLGSETVPWTAQLKWSAANVKENRSIILPVKLLENPAAEHIALLEGSGTATAYFAISSPDMAGLPPGEYEVSVGISDQTDKVKLTVRAGILVPASMTESQLVKFSRYYWQAGDAKKVWEYAGIILKKNPVSVNGFSLAGDAQLMLADYEKALHNYQEATRYYYKQNGEGAEPPEYLLNMIGLVKEKMGK